MRQLDSLNNEMRLPSEQRSVQIPLPEPMSSSHLLMDTMSSSGGDDWAQYHYWRFRSSSPRSFLGLLWSRRSDFIVESLSTSYSSSYSASISYTTSSPTRSQRWRKGSLGTREKSRVPSSTVAVDEVEDGVGDAEDGLLNKRQHVGVFDLCVVLTWGFNSSTNQCSVFLYWPFYP